MKRIRHSLLTLKTFAGLTRGTLGLTSEWLEPLHPHENMPAHSTVFVADAAEKVASMIKNSIPLIALPDWIGCDKTTAGAMINNGFVEKITGTKRSGGSTPAPRITLTSVDALMKNLSDTSVQLAHAKPGLNTMTLVAKHQHWQVDRIIRLALTGRIDLYQLIGRKDFESFLVDENQVLRIVEMSPVATRLTKYQAADALQVDVKSIEKLMRIADSSGAPLIRRVVPISGPQHKRHQVSKADLDRFASAHVSIGCLAAELGRPRDQVAAKLQLQRILPITSDLTADNQIYRRADL